MKSNYTLRRVHNPISTQCNLFIAEVLPFVKENYHYLIEKYSDNAFLISRKNVIKLYPLLTSGCRFKYFTVNIYDCNSFGVGLLF